MKDNWKICIALYFCLIETSAATNCDYTSRARGPCDQTANQGSCADYYQVFATHDYQYLTSPDYPNNYKDNIVCRWVVSSCKCYDSSNPNAQFRVEMEMVEFDMQNSPSCTKDFVEIKDGPRLWDHRFANFCGNKCANGDTNITRSFSKHLLVTFQTDVFSPADPAGHKGFLARYKCFLQPEEQKDDLVLRPVNYALIVFSCLLIVLFGSATVLLIVQEKRRVQL